jgi:hypothetical protein
MLYLQLIFDILYIHTGEEQNMYLFKRGVSNPLFVHTLLYLYAKLNNACVRSLPLETLSCIPFEIRSRIN